MKPRSLYWLAVILITGLPLFAQMPAVQDAKAPKTANFHYGNTKWFPTFWEPYSTPYVPEPRMSNSQRLHSLIRDGKLHLTVEDAIALALENNLEIAVARFNISYAQTDILRSKSGGAFRGVQGMFGSQALFAGAIGGGVSGFSGGGTGGAGGVTGGGFASSVGTIGCCDPTAGVNLGWDRRSSPLNYLVVSGIPVVTTQTSNVTAFYGQGFLTGTSYVVAMSGYRQSSTSLNTLFNPVVPTGLTLGFTQRLLNGFGYRANAKFIRIAKNDSKIADSTFRQQVITTITSVLNLYWDFLAFRDNVRVAEQSLALAQKLLSDNKRAVEIGTMAPIEVVRAESEVAARQQDLIVAQTSLQQQQESIKTAVSKQVDKELTSAPISPDDKLPEPKPDDVPPLDEALRQAMQNRPEIETADYNLRNQEIIIKANRNALLPELDVFANYAPTGISGNQLVCPAGYFLNPANTACTGPGGTVPFTVQTGGISQSFTKMFQGRFPDYNYGINLTIPLRNRQQQADTARSLLERRQLETQRQQTKNTIAQDVRNAVIAVTQAKARIEAARKAVELQQRTLDAEQKKFQLGESTVYLVIQTQRDLATAENNEVQARSVYAKAITQLNQAMGTTLQKNNVELSDAVSGEVTRVPNIPGSHPQPSGQQPANTGY